MLFWIRSHYDGPGKDVGLVHFKSWKYESDDNLVRSKVGTILDERMFLKMAEENFPESGERYFRLARHAENNTGSSIFRSR